MILPPPGRGLAAALLGLALLAAGCRREAPPPHVETIRVDGTSLAAAAEVGVDRAAIEGLARAALTEAGFAAEPAGGATYRLRLDLSTLRLGPVAGQGLTATVGVDLDLSAAKGEDPARRERGSASVRVGSDGPAGALRAALAQALGDAVRGLRLGLQADAKPVAALVADLDSADRRVRERAVEALGERRDRSAVPALVKRLQDGEAQVVHKAVGALARLKDPRAVPALIDLTRDGDPSITLRLVTIVGDIGGPDAAGWLQNLEQASPDPRIRQAATDALAELGRAAEPPKDGPPAAR